MFEVAVPRKGEVRTSDLRLIYGAAMLDMPHVDVFVITDVGAPIAARIELTTVPFGWTQRRAFLCPVCGEPRHVLRSREGRLRCNKCRDLKHRTRRQTERSCVSFKRMGGLEEDRLLRLLLPTGRRPANRMAEAARLMDVIMASNLAHVALLRRKVEALKTVITTAG